jgi:hypothetical protein
MKNTYVHVAKVYNNRHKSDHILGPTPADCRHRNGDKFSQGDESARIRSRRGDSHFWVILCHKFIGVVCFMI